MIPEFLSYNGPGANFALIVAGLSDVPPALPAALGFLGAEVVHTYQGRYAISLVCQLLNIGPGDDVLVPAYNCGAETDPFVKTGSTARFYRIDDRGGIDIQDIIDRVMGSTKIVHVSHFFGWAQDIVGLAQWCKEKGIFVAEDCALCLFSQGPDDTIGRIGDAAIYSLVKNAPDAGRRCFSPEKQIGSQGDDSPQEAAPARYPPQHPASPDKMVHEQQSNLAAALGHKTSAHEELAERLGRSGYRN